MYTIPFRSVGSLLTACLLILADCNPAAKEAAVPYQFDTDTAWRNGYQMHVYGRPPLEYLEQARATAVVWSVYHGGIEAGEQQYVRDLHRHGIKVSSNFSTMQGSPSVSHDEKLNRETACATFEGKATMALWIVPDPPFLPCNNNAAWLDFLQKRAYEHVDGEADSLHIDEVEGIAGHLYFAGFDEHCLAGFRKFLSGRFSAAELAANFGITNIATFDYRAYLRAAGGEKIDSDPNAELRRMYVRFQLTSRQQSMRSIINNTRSYAKTRYVSFTANTFFLNANKLSLVPDLDYLAYENTIDFPPKGRLLGQHYLAKAAAPGKMAAMFPNIIDLLFFKDGLDWGVYLHWIIEAFAAGQSFLIPHNAYVFGGGELSVSGSITLPTRLLRPYADFMKKHWAAHDAAPVANVAVLFPYGVVLDEYIDQGYKTPWMTSEPAHLRYLEITRELQVANIPFTTVFSGDGELVDQPLKSGDLTGIKTLLVPTQTALDSGTQSVLDAFTNRGGKLLSDTEITADGVRAASAPMLSSTAPDEIGLVYTADPGHLFLHVINYDYRKKQHAFRAPAPFKVKLNHPEIFSPAAAKAWLHVPGAASRELQMITGGGVTALTIDGIQDYALIEIR